MTDDMKQKILIFTLLISLMLGLAVSAQAKTLFDELEEDPAIGGKYYLCATVDGTDYYYRVTNSTLSESVTDTSPYSFYVTEDPEDKGIKEFTLEALGKGFYMGYPSGDNIHKIYSFDVDNDDVVDTGLNSGLDASRHCFFWDGTNKQIFAMRKNVKYVLVVKLMKNVKTGNEELHMLSVPASDLQTDNQLSPVRFVIKHECQFSQELSHNEYSHWYGCDCGEKKELQLHQVESWTVTKEAAIGEEGSRTGLCTVCGETATEAIPALKEKTEVTEEAEETQQTSLSPAPWVIVTAAALAVLGLVILVFGNRKKKQ